jgi:Xaa-Pro aminopeptidase
VRSGPNTLCHFDDHPPDRRLEADDILYFDLGPVFGAYEADFGVTMVLGQDPEKLKIRDALTRHFAILKEAFSKNPQMTGAELFALAQSLATSDGLLFWGKIAGHTVGEFPHKTLLGRGPEFLIGPDNHSALLGQAPSGRTKHWILEIFLAAPSRRFAGFFEDLLTI